MYYMYLLPKIPGSGEVFDYFVDFETGRLESWEKIIPTFSYDKEVLSILLFRCYINLSQCVH